MHPYFLLYLADERIARYRAESDEHRRGRRAARARAGGVTSTRRPARRRRAHD